jgi:hypothetical protein
LGCNTLALTKDERRQLEKYCHKWSFDLKKIDNNKSFDANMSHLQKIALDACRTKDVIEIKQMTEELQQYLDSNFLLKYSTYIPPKKPSEPVSAPKVFSLRAYTAKRLSAQHPKDDRGNNNGKN